MAMVFSKQRFDFMYAKQQYKSEQKFQKLKHSKKKNVFLAKCIENAVLREKYCQQNRGKWARETKQATYNRLH